MREIIFRGKRMDNREWYYGSYLFLHISSVDWTGAKRGKPEDVHYIVNDQDINYAVYPSTIGQYTGLKDKNGKRIFEGDIIKSDNGKQSSISVVKFGEYYPKLFFAMLDICCTGVQHLNANGFYLESAKHEDMILFKSRHLVVIGNIYDNPDLLLESKEEK